MAKYAIFFSYTPEALSAMIKNPSDRSTAARQVVEGLGGSLESFYWMFGEYDGIAIFDVPDSVSAAAFSVAVSSSGAFSKVRTTELFTSSDQAALIERAKTGQASYTPPTG